MFMHDETLVIGLWSPNKAKPMASTTALQTTVSTSVHSSIASGSSSSSSSSEAQSWIASNGNRTATRYHISDFISPQVSSYFIAGGVAGAASRTVVSPLERLKIIQQVQPPDPSRQYKGVWRSLVRMWREEGAPGLLRGNGINCLRIFPYSAVQFTTYEFLKKWFTNYGERQLDTPTRLFSGALAGITSVCATYPLDLVRSRLSIATATMASRPIASQQVSSSTSSSANIPRPALASAYHTSVSSSSTPSSAATFVANAVKEADAAVQHIGRSELTMKGMAHKVMREEGGLRALYKGLPATAFGVAPYVGINFAAYEALRGVITPPGKTTALRKLACGALAGSISQTITYPMDVLRRKMQVSGMASIGVSHSSAFDALQYILKTDGVKGLYKGLWPNLLKVAPSIATSFYTYELVKEYLLS